MQVSVKADVKRLTKDLNKIQRQQIPFATVLALTRTGAIAKDRLGKEIKTKFRSPKRYTLNAPFSTRAKKTLPRTIVGYKDRQEKYLAPHVYGGPRSQGRFEYLLRSKGILSNDEYVLPGKGAKITRGTFQKVLSSLGAQSDRYQNSPSKSRKSTAYHVGYRGNIRGIWQTGKPYPALIFLIVKGAPKYKKVLDPFGVITKTVNKYYEPQFIKALNRALATAR